MKHHTWQQNNSSFALFTALVFRADQRYKLQKQSFQYKTPIRNTCKLFLLYIFGSFWLYLFNQSTKKEHGPLGLSWRCSGVWAEGHATGCAPLGQDRGSCHAPMGQKGVSPLAHEQQKGQLPFSPYLPLLAPSSPNGESRALGPSAKGLKALEGLGQRIGPRAPSGLRPSVYGPSALVQEQGPQSFKWALGPEGRAFGPSSRAIGGSNLEQGTAGLGNFRVHETLYPNLPLFHKSSLISKKETFEVLKEVSTKFDKTSSSLVNKPLINSQLFPFYHDFYLQNYIGKYKINSKLNRVVSANSSKLVKTLALGPSACWPGGPPEGLAPTGHNKEHEANRYFFARKPLIISKDLISNLEKRSTQQEQLLYSGTSMVMGPEIDFLPRKLEGLNKQDFIKTSINNKILGSVNFKPQLGQTEKLWWCNSVHTKSLTKEQKHTLKKEYCQTTKLLGQKSPDLEWARKPQSFGHLQKKISFNREFIQPSFFRAITLENKSSFNKRSQYKNIFLKSRLQSGFTFPDTPLLNKKETWKKTLKKDTLLNKINILPLQSFPKSDFAGRSTKPIDALGSGRVYHPDGFKRKVKQIKFPFLELIYNYVPLQSYISYNQQDGFFYSAHPSASLFSPFEQRSSRLHELWGEGYRSFVDDLGYKEFADKTFKSIKQKDQQNSVLLDKNADTGTFNCFVDNYTKGVIGGKKGLEGYGLWPKSVGLGRRLGPSAQVDGPPALPATQSRRAEGAKRGLGLMRAFGPNPTTTSGASQRPSEHNNPKDHDSQKAPAFGLGLQHSDHKSSITRVPKEKQQCLFLNPKGWKPKALAPESFFGTSYMQLGERFTLENQKSKNQIGTLYNVHCPPLFTDKTKNFPYLSLGTSYKTVFGNKSLKKSSRKMVKTQSPITATRLVSKWQILSEKPTSKSVGFNLLDIKPGEAFQRVGYNPLIGLGDIFTKNQSIKSLTFAKNLFLFKRISGKSNGHLINPFKYYNPGTKRERNIEDTMLTLEGYRKSRLFPKIHGYYQGVGISSLPIKVGLYNNFINGNVDQQGILGGMRQRTETQRRAEKGAGFLDNSKEIQKKKNTHYQNPSLDGESKPVQENLPRWKQQKKKNRFTNCYPLRTVLITGSQKSFWPTLRPIDNVEYNFNRSNIDHQPFGVAAFSQTKGFYFEKIFASRAYETLNLQGASKNRLANSFKISTKTLSPSISQQTGTHAVNGATVALGAFAKHADGPSATQAEGAKRGLGSKSTTTSIASQRGKKGIGPKAQNNAQQELRPTVMLPLEQGPSDRTKGPQCFTIAQEQQKAYDSQKSFGQARYRTKGGLQVTQIEILKSLSKILFFIVVWSSYKNLAIPLAQSTQFLPAAFTEAIGLQSFQQKYRIIRGVRNGLRGPLGPQKDPQAAQDSSTKQTFKNLAGAEKTLVELRDLIWTFRLVGTENSLGEQFLAAFPYLGSQAGHQRSSVRFKKRNRFLLVGPPGTGKTLLVKALAAEINVPVIVQPISGLRMITGVDNPVSALFHVARQLKPCIIFLDELDTLGSSLDNSRINITTEQKLGIRLARKYTYTLLLELDGLTSLTRDLLVIGATNRPETLNPALTRAGRFETIINCHLPDEKQRLAVLSLYLSNTQGNSNHVLHKSVSNILDFSQKLNLVLQRTPLALLLGRRPTPFLPLLAPSVVRSTPSSLHYADGSSAQGTPRPSVRKAFRPLVKGPFPKGARPMIFALGPRVHLEHRAFRPLAEGVLRNKSTLFSLRRLYHRTPGDILSQIYKNSNQGLQQNQTLKSRPKVHSQNIISKKLLKKDNNLFYLNYVAQKCSGLSQASIETVVNESALEWLSKGQSFYHTLKSLERAIESVRKLSPKLATEGALSYSSNQPQSFQPYSFDFLPELVTEEASFAESEVTNQQSGETSFFRSNQQEHTNKEKNKNFFWVCTAYQLTGSLIFLHKLGLSSKLCRTVPCRAVPCPDGARRGKKGQEGAKRAKKGQEGFGRRPKSLGHRPIPLANASGLRPSASVAGGPSAWTKNPKAEDPNNQVSGPSLWRGPTPQGRVLAHIDKQNLYLTLTNNFAGQAALSLYSATRPQTFKLSRTEGLYRNPLYVSTTLLTYKGLMDRGFTAIQEGYSRSSEFLTFRKDKKQNSIQRTANSRFKDPIRGTAIYGSKEVGVNQLNNLSFVSERQNFKPFSKISSDAGGSINMSVDLPQQPRHSLSGGSFAKQNVQQNNSFQKQVSRQVKLSNCLTTGWFRMYLSRPLFRYDNKEYIENKEYYPQNNYIGVMGQKKEPLYWAIRPQVTGAEGPFLGARLVRSIEGLGLRPFSYGTTEGPPTLEAYRNSQSIKQSAFSANVSTFARPRSRPLTQGAVPWALAQELQSQEINLKINILKKKSLKTFISNQRHVLQKNYHQKNIFDILRTPINTLDFSFGRIEETSEKEISSFITQKQQTFCKETSPSIYALYLAVVASAFHRGLLVMQNNRELVDYCAYNILRYGIIYDFSISQICKKF